MTLSERNVKIIVAYDGSGFFGFQLQPVEPTVQGVLESALKLILGSCIRVHGSGRTDAGVHAVAQAVSFRTTCPIPVEKLIKALNGILPPTVRIKSVEEVESGFHARYSATGKHYRYLFRHQCEPSAFLARYFCQIEQRLDFAAMKRAAGIFVGEHDFSAFAKSGNRVENPVRVIYAVDLSEKDRVIAFDICGSGFLHNMVRNMARALILVGEGRMEPEEIGELYRNQDRRRLGPPAPAGGLYLMKVMY